MNAFRRPLPGKSRRTIASAQTMPKTVFAGTAIAVMISVSSNAWTVSAEDSAVQAGDSPFSNVRQNTTVSGPSRITAR